MTAAWPPSRAAAPLAVLVSGGLDSGVLLAEALTAFPAVHPVYVRTGATWEPAEFDHLRGFLKAVAAPNLRPVVELAMPVTDLYGRHWSLTGDGVPDADSPDEAMNLPGRNVILLAKPLIWCRLNGVPALATGPLGTNPFPDATPAFYDAFAGVVGQAVGGPVVVLHPYLDLGLHKADVVRRGVGLPLGLTFSCAAPVGGRHCARCNKCAERCRGFASAGVSDPTEYAG